MEGEKKFKPIDLTEENVLEIAKKCKSTSPDKLLYIAKLFEDSPEAKGIAFDEEQLRLHEKEIRYLFGQIALIHTSKNSADDIDLRDLLKKYDGTSWTKNPDAVFDLAHMASYFSLCNSIYKWRDTVRIMVNTHVLTPTLSPKDRKYFPWWREHSAEWGDAPRQLKPLGECQKPNSDGTRVENPMEGEKKFKPLDLNDSTVAQIFNYVALSRPDYSDETYITNLVTWNKNNDAYFFSKARLEEQKKNILYLMGQLSIVHNSPNAPMRMSIAEAGKKYDGTYWTRNPDMVMHLWHIANYFKLTLPIDADTYLTIIDCSKITLTCSPKDTKIFPRWWIRARKEWEA